MGADLTDEFEERRDRLRALAIRMLGTRDEAEDAVQETWMRLDRAGGQGIDNLDGWLTTVTARICLNRLRSRRTRTEVPLDRHVPDPVVHRVDAVGPDEEAILADEVGAALLLVLDALTPPERLAFVLHDVFAVPFDEIATMIERTPDAARQLASRARRRVRGATVPDADMSSQRRVVDAFFAAARDGDFARLVSVLHPDVVLHSDGGAARQPLSVIVRGSGEVARRALWFAIPNAVLHPVLVNGRAGVVVMLSAKPFVLMGFTVVAEAITVIEVLADPERIRRLDFPTL
ncbi:sigma-70 family RNA polymerase sigma factor [Phytoactinopolyspora mesophila]|uniref:Sigma-70 family RNA polymerase sigma factor n=1 Tax=Phytoactinopolyspora mesophila TaxID=2650750 RepID=A0A7K3M866_9ACTN|nr:sigma-70 family RNA polymerase sigma factor [Phytoactinopolyspora mesophila]NDL59475.1 sigma-70 family RNA polymerase sigma factor [Phytoactinopolyspora mesophila]